MTTYFTCGVHRAELDFKDEATAIAFAQQMARKMTFWGFDVGVLLTVADSNGEVIATMRVKRPMH